MNEKGDSDAGDVVHGTSPGSHGSHAMNETKMLRARSASLLLRLASCALCVVALVVMVMDKQTKYFVIPINPPITLTKTAKYTGATVLVYYVYSNGIVAGYLLFHAIFSAFTARKGGCCNGRFRCWLTFIGDQTMVYFLLAAAAAATEVAYLAERGNKSTGWVAECDLFGRFCNQVGASVIVCFISVICMTVLAAISAYLLFNSSGQRVAVGRNGPTANKNFVGRV